MPEHKIILPTQHKSYCRIFLLNTNQNAKIILHLLKHTDAELFCGIFAYLYPFVLPTKTTPLKNLAYILKTLMQNMDYNEHLRLRENPFSLVYAASLRPIALIPWMLAASHPRAAPPLKILKKCARVSKKLSIKMLRGQLCPSLFCLAV